MDVPLLVSCAAISWFAWQWYKNPSPGNAVLFLLISAIGSLIKLPVTFFIFVMMSFILLSGFYDRGRLVWKKRILLALMLTVSIYIAAWGGAGFRFSYLAPGATVDHRNGFIPPYDNAETSLYKTVANWLWNWKVFPEITFATITHITVFKERSYFLNGEVSNKGWYYYFGETVLLKTPLPILAGLLVVLWFFIRRIKKRKTSMTWGWRIERAVIFGGSFAILALMIILLRVNMGHRYILFIYFPLSVALGYFCAQWIHTRGWYKYAGHGLLLIQVLTCLLAFPHFSTYFNLITGSPYKASKFLRSSDTDWGQDIAILSKAIENYGFHRINLAIDGINRPESYGITDYIWINPQAGLFKTQTCYPPDPQFPTVISVNILKVIRKSYPGLYDREPDIELNSILIFLPGSNGGEDSLKYKRVVL